MNDEGSNFMLAAIGAVVVAGIMIGLVLLQNLFAYSVVDKAVHQTPVAFPTSQFTISTMLTPLVFPTPFSLDLYTYHTPTPDRNDSVYITAP